MNYPKQYVAFLVHFHGDRDYFECHEVLEEYWKETGMERNSIWVGLIQLAVSFYHYRRGNVAGAIKLMKRVRKILQTKRDDVRSLGLNDSELITLANRSLHDMHSYKPYTAIELPIEDEILLNVCKEKVEQQGIEWGNDHDILDYYIVHKHALRDRKQIISQRKTSLSYKKYKRQHKLVWT